MVPHRPGSCRSCRADGLHRRRRAHRPVPDGATRPTSLRGLHACRYVNRAGHRSRDRRLHLRRHGPCLPVERHPGRGVLSLEASLFDHLRDGRVEQYRREAYKLRSRDELETRARQLAHARFFGSWRRSRFLRKTGLGAFEGDRAEGCLALAGFATAEASGEADTRRSPTSMTWPWLRCSAPPRSACSPLRAPSWKGRCEPMRAPDDSDARRERQRAPRRRTGTPSRCCRPKAVLLDRGPDDGSDEARHLRLILRRRQLLDGGEKDGAAQRYPAWKIYDTSTSRPEVPFTSRKPASNASGDERLPDRDRSHGSATAGTSRCSTDRGDRGGRRECHAPPRTSRRAG
ncbi:hypothetical protein S1361_31980 [Streptomyces cyanogenus]|uniref:Uncharacterized protein n=1 Tax=Streptomyces cyanogenus TaxID=80860 RepID=A0ABX7TYX0_STRCY|nr:hypothetical protein S1361_31980 [Streptomyces cyanogenus]